MNESLNTDARSPFSMVAPVAADPRAGVGGVDSRWSWLEGCKPCRREWGLWERGESS